MGDLPTITPEKIITTISNLKTGEIYKTEEEWKTKGIAESDIRRDVKVIMPRLDILPKTT
jgi:hypothetical protein|tara:strand:- start:11 stop:190 length:180 start_codon:yes stop_codon:yes gene_type:complete